MTTTPVPEQPDLSACATCDGPITRYDETAWNGAEDEVLASWWSHHHHPADDHEAVPTA